MEERGVSKPVAVIACTAIAFFYVAILYAPTFILRLPPPTSFKSFMIRRFICAGVSYVIVCALILPWQAVVFPLSLISLTYIGSLVVKSLSLLNSLNKHWNCGGDHSFDCVKNVLQKFVSWMFSIAYNVLAWRNYFVVQFGAPFGSSHLPFEGAEARLQEFKFVWLGGGVSWPLFPTGIIGSKRRHHLRKSWYLEHVWVPLLLCGGFRTYSVIFFCPIFFSLADLNHLLELYSQ